MHWSTYVNTLHGAAVPLDNDVEAKVAYSAFLSSLDEDIEDISFEQFIAEYRKKFAQESEDFG